MFSLRVYKATIGLKNQPLISFVNPKPSFLPKSNWKLCFISKHTTFGQTKLIYLGVISQSVCFHSSRVFQKNKEKEKRKPTKKEDSDEFDMDGVKALIEKPIEALKKSFENLTAIKASPGK